MLGFAYIWAAIQFRIKTAFDEVGCLDSAYEMGVDVRTESVITGAAQDHCVHVTTTQGIRRRVIERQYLRRC